MQSLSKVFKPYDGLFLILAFGVVIVYVLTAGHGFPLDDSWIHQVYARNLAHNGEWAFIPGQPSAASTSPLYTVLLSIGYRLNMPYTLWTHFLGALSLAVSGMLGARMGQRLLPGVRYAGWVTGLTLVLSWHLIWAAAAGMETIIFSMFTLVMMALAWGELDERSPQPRDIVLRGVAFGVLAALTVLARPEGMMLIGLIGLAILIVRPQRHLVLWIIGAGVSFMLFLSPYLLLNLQLTGGLLPDTAAAKHAGVAPLLALSYPDRVIRMTTPLAAGGQLLLVPGMVFFTIFTAKRLANESRCLFYLLPVAWGIGLILLYAAYLPAYFQHGRYVVPILPSLIVIGVVGTVKLLKIGKTSLTGRVLTRVLTISAAVTFVFFAFVAGPSIYATDVRIIEEEMVAHAVWIAQNIPQDELLVTHDIGAIGYFASRSIIDIAGLVSPELVPFILDEEAMWNYLERNDARYLLAFPDQVPGDDVEDEHLCLIRTSGGQTSPSVGGPTMSLYALSWDGQCPA